MTTENLICIGVGIALGAAGILFVLIIRAKIRAYRLRRFPRGTVLFRP